MDDLDLIQCEDYYGEEFPNIWDLAYELFFDNMEILKNDNRTKETTGSKES